jgi:cob(I)alamin adenosyltransferase
LGHRLSKIYTRTGDAGTTGLADGSRVAKNSPRINTLGDIDELNSLIGAVLVHDLDPDLRDIFTNIQHALFDIGGELAIPGAVTVTAQYVETLEQALDSYNGKLPPLKEFILPGGGPGAVATHIARAVCRRAERAMVSLGEETPVNEHSRRYVNRLSDFLFVIARVLARAEDGEVYWQPGRNRTTAT